MLGLKCLLRNRLSLRFQYYSWYILPGSLLLSLLPSGIWPEFQTTALVGEQAFAITNASNHTANAAITGTGWIQDTTELIVNSESSLPLLIQIFCAIVLLRVLENGGITRKKQATRRHFVMGEIHEKSDLIHEVLINDS